MGVKVSETKAEIITEPATTIPNSRNNLPVIPCKKITGKKTAANVTVVEITAKYISFEPCKEASQGDIPSSILA